MLPISILAYCIITVATTHKNRPRSEEVLRVVLLNLFLVCCCVFIHFFWHHEAAISRLFLITFMLFGDALMILARIYVRKWHRYNKPKFIVITDYEDGTADVEKTLIASGHRYDISSTIWCGTENDVDDIIDSHRLVPETFDYAVIACKDKNREDIMQLVTYFADMGVICVEMLQLDLPLQYNTHFAEYGNQGVVYYQLHQSPDGMLVVKRMVDILGGLVGCFVTAILFCVLGPLIKLESPGPVFFSQTRIGLNGKRFKIWKFRSMYKDAEARKAALMEQNKMQGLMFKMDDDPRITKVGKFIRKTSLDEFPQFWNVLKGDMSLVGTRPPTEDEFLQYNNYYRRRISIIPGLTGVWQVSGRSDITDFEQVVAMDLWYIDNWSLWLDCRLIIKTALSMFTGKGAK